MKKAAAILAVVLIVLLLPVLCVRLRIWAQKPMIRRQVMAHQTELTAAAEQALASGDANAARPAWTRNGFTNRERSAVFYDVSGVGFGSATCYFGVCYASDSLPHPYPGMEDYDEIAVMFGFRWEEPGGDNGCRIEQIDGNIYYYETWF